MANGREKEDEEIEGREGEGEELPPENQRTITAQHPSYTQSASHRRELGQTDALPQRSPYDMGNVNTALPDVGCSGYQGNPLVGQSQLIPGEAPSLSQEYARAPLFHLQPSQGVTYTPHLRQSHQQGRQIQRFRTNNFQRPFGYGHPQSLPYSYPPPFQHLQPQQPTAYGNGGTGYYPGQHLFTRCTPDSTGGVIFRQEQNYLAPLHTPGPSVMHGAITPGLAGSVLLQTGSTPISRHSSESSPISSRLRGPPRKPKQSGYALWCGNLPAQTNIVELKNHFSRDATDEIESVFLISKSNCAFVNYKTEASCTAALARFHDSRFQGAKLVCRLRKGTAAPPAGTPTGPRSNVKPGMQSAMFTDDSPARGTAQQGVEQTQTSARTTEEKFFVLKSLTIEDLDASVRSGSWATQSHNEAALNAAYKSAENVYLVFSANKSGEYYGYARMTSGIDDTASAPESPLPRPTPSSAAPVDNSITIPTPATEHAPKGHIIDDSARGTVFWEAERDDNTDTQEPENEAAAATAGTADSGIQQQNLGHPFNIEWLSTEKLPFHRVRGLRNPWNQNREVKIARDGTEIEPSVGAKLVNLFHTTQTPAPSAGPPLLYPAVQPLLPPSAYPPDPRGGRHY